MRVLGVDPGLTRCGIGVVDGEDGRTPKLVEAVKPPEPPKPPESPKAAEPPAAAAPPKAAE